MREIGLGNNYRWYNGSGSCGYIRQNAVAKLPEVLSGHGLEISQDWLDHCRTANQVDQINSKQFGLTNTWVACSYAIADAIHRKEGGENAGHSPDKHQWQFWSDKERTEWERRQRSRYF